MPNKRKPSLRFSDWVKVWIVFAVATGAGYYVYREYTEPFDLMYDIRRQQMVQAYESTSPFVRKIPYGGGGERPELLPARAVTP